MLYFTTYRGKNNMREIEAIIIEKAIIHVLDKNADEPLLTDFTQEINEEIHEFLEKHIIKALRDEDNKTAKFRDGRSAVENACLEIFQDNGNFVDISKKIALHLFKSMKENNNIPSSDLVVCMYSSQGDQYIGILKLDYKTSFIHNIEYCNDGFKISIMSQTIGLPGIGQRIQKCAFIKKPLEDNVFELIVLDKQAFQKDTEADVAQFFLQKFLNCAIVIDNRDHTKLFKNVTEKWARKNLKNDIDVAQELREEMVESLKNGVDIDLQKFAGNIFGNDIDRKHKLLEYMVNEGLETESFEVDKKWVEKRMTKRTIKTDSGIEIKGDYEILQDPMKFQIQKNGDGSINLIVRNIKSFNER